MATASLSTFLKQLIRGMAAETLSDQTDRQLVEQFLARREEAAFEAIVRRHGAMVYRVCWRVVRQTQDCEDAFQATFLILAQKLRSVRNLDSLASWLHGVAHRVALQAKGRAATRCHHERKATMPQGERSRDLGAEELLTVLDAELGMLPDKWRLPLILCYLEGRTQEQSASQLGWSKSTLRRRLEEARDALGCRLKGRDIAWSAALSAVLLGDCIASAAPACGLVTSTVEATASVAAGKTVATAASAKVIALTEGVTKAMFITKLKTAAAALLAAVVIAASVAGLRLPGWAANVQPLKADRTDRRDQAPAAKAPNAPTKTSPGEKPNADVAVNGRVLGPDGKPVAGAKLYLGYASPKDMKYPVRATSGDDGRFKFIVEKSELDGIDSDDRTIQVMAVAEGHGCDWAALGPAGEEVTLRLVKDDVPIGVRILDPDGKPVAGARLTVMDVVAPQDLGSYLDAIHNYKVYASTKHWDGPLPGQSAVVTTGADGRFKLAGAGRERIVRFRLEGPAIASTSLHVMTREAPPDKGGGPQGYWSFYGASSDYVGLASRPVRGVVRDKETGKPITGVSVEHYHGQGPSAVTDKNGRYELLGLYKEREYSLVVKPPDGLHFGLPLRVQDTPGLGPLTCDIELTRGLMVRGRVTDKATGKPVAKARVEYHPLAGNTYANQMADVSRPCAAVTTGPDGSYALTVLPGQGVIAVAARQLEAYMPALVTPRELKDFFRAPLIEQRGEYDLTAAGGANSFRTISQNSYNALVLLEPGEKEDGLVKDVALEPPLERKGRVIGPDGQPLTGALVYGLVRHGVETLQGAEFTVRGINPRANRPLVFYHKDKNLGFYVKELRGNEAAPLTVKLQPCGSASGRVIDQDGQPVPGLRLFAHGRLLPISGYMGGGSGLVVTTDREGRFRAEGLVPGQEYHVLDAGSGSFPRVYAPVVVESGEHKDLGDIKMTERRE